MNVSEEDLDRLANEALQNMEHPSGFIKVFKTGFRTSEALINERLTNHLKDELNGLSEIEKVAYLKAMGKTFPIESFSEKVHAIGRKKIVTELKREEPKIITEL